MWARSGALQPALKLTMSSSPPVRTTGVRVPRGVPPPRLAACAAAQRCASIAPLPLHQPEQDEPEHESKPVSQLNQEVAVRIPNYISVPKPKQGTAVRTRSSGSWGVDQRKQECLR